MKCVFSRIYSITKKFCLSGFLAAFLIASILHSPPPSRATAANLNVDCSAFVNAGNYYIIPSRSVNVTTTGCSAIVRSGVNVGTSLTINASEVDTSTALQLIFYSNFVSVGDPSNDEKHRTNFYLARNDATSLGSIELARTATMTIPSTSPNYFTNSNNPLGGISGCGMAAGSHPYITHNLTITATGNFTFRITKTIPDTDANSGAAVPPGSYHPLDWPEGYPISDPFLAVYQNFDPANPDLNIVGCNDDIASGDRKNYLSDGTVIGDYWSKFEANLSPGSYTLVLTTYGTFNPSSWATQTNNTDQTAQMQLWGPSGSIVPIASPTPTPGGLEDDGSWKIKPIQSSDCIEKSFKINFAGGSSELNKKANQIIKNISSEIKRCGFINIKLTGYTSIDQKDSPEYKIFRKNLSLNRARKVQTELKKNLGTNFKNVKYKILGLSEKNPIKSNKYEKTRKANRRVEIVITK
jgi:outer membrane protein OmpA-like peptidoglycan-associated protein